MPDPLSATPRPRPGSYLLYEAFAIARIFDAEYQRLGESGYSGDELTTMTIGALLTKGVVIHPLDCPSDPIEAVAKAVYAVTSEADTTWDDLVPDADVGGKDHHLVVARAAVAAYLAAQTESKTSADRREGLM